MTCLAHGNSQSLKQQPVSLNGTVIGPLHICDCCISWFYLWDFSSGSRGCLWCSGWLLETYSSYWIALPSLSKEEGSWSYSSLIYHSLLMPMGGLPLSERISRWSGLIGGEWGDEWEVTGRSGREAYG